MRELATDGLRTFDLWGVVEPGDPGAQAEWAGFSGFKRQFGGQPPGHPGTFDLVIDPLFCRLRDLRERDPRLARQTVGHGGPRDFLPVDNTHRRPRSCQPWTGPAAAPVEPPRP